MSNSGYSRGLVFLLIALAIAGGGLWRTNNAVAPREPTWEDVVREARDGGYRLTNTEEIKQRLTVESAPILLVDTRQDWEYAAGHIKGAVNFPIEPTSWSRWWKKDKLAAFLGPYKDRPIVFY
jgi:predicted sulfurtransferase